MHEYRTHTCDDIRESDIHSDVKLSGWIHSVRDHGGVTFIDLRDHYGITQVVIHPENHVAIDPHHLHNETVIRVIGQVVARDADTYNNKIPTGEVEVTAKQIDILGKAEALPLVVNTDEPTSERLRLTYRFLDLRRNRMHKNIMLRSRVISRIRQKMTAMGFDEFQTPILTASSPEGARDYLVPSRVHPGKFYALPQAPQQFKQLLMVSGFDKYFQIAPCFRDEDARADRSPGEFYQLDMEMSFVTQEDVFSAVEELLIDVFETFGEKPIAAKPFPRIAYTEAMDRFGTDKPDLRNPLEMVDVTDVFAGSDFNAFAGIAAKKTGTVRAIAAKGIAESTPKRFYENMITFAQTAGAKGLGYIVFSDGEAKSPIANYLDTARVDELKRRCGVGDGDVLFFIADTIKQANAIASHVIPELGRRLNLIDESAFRFCWVVDFPMFELDGDTGEVGFSHNPFSMPQGGMEALKTKDPLDILAYQYDIVCDGVELSSGAIRNHLPDVMYKSFEIAGYDRSVVDEKFGGMIKAFTFGAPPHGGIAPGIDRIVMLLAGEENIREVIAFPMNQKAEDLLMQAPSAVSPKQLRELGIKIATQKKDS
ncbi:MAG: aspartate--tRNA ligase [Lentisphaeria bacterium]|nr:aspartate--tRNA ligase [Lentisphaeria bacterium]